MGDMYENQKSVSINFPPRLGNGKIDYIMEKFFHSKQASTSVSKNRYPIRLPGNTIGDDPSL